MRQVFPFLLLLLLPLALAISPPAPPTLVWGDINASCALTTISPGVSVVAEANSVDVSSLPLDVEGNIYRFGGPSASDPKLVIPATYSEANIILEYPSAPGKFVLGVVLSDGSLHYVHYTLSESNCASIYPPAKYSVTVSLPDDCNGSVQGMVFRLYYDGNEVYSTTLSGTHYATFSFDLNGLKYPIPQGSGLSARVYLDSTYTTWYNHFYYGKDVDWSISLPCDTYFSAAQQTEQNTAASSQSGSGVSSESNSASSVGVPARTVSSSSTAPRAAPKATAKHAPAHAATSEENVNVPVGASGSGTRSIFGVPLDQAIVVALVVIIAVIVVVRFFI